MGLHRFFCQDIVEPVTELTGSEAHHLSRVLRLGQGQQIELFDGNGILAQATIKEIRKDKAVLHIDEMMTNSPPDSPRIIIAASVAKGDRFDWLLEKCTELGADRITPVIFERTVKHASNPQIYQRWKNIVVSAAKQSKRIFLPVIDRVNIFPGAFDMLKKQYPEATIIFGSLNKDDKSVFECFCDDEMIVFIGPEGGLTDNEIDILKSNGAFAIRLTETILRTETAAISVCSILTALRDSKKKS
jgi:16S rRNA (uracil1498-N3)-methyltransferase